MFWCFKAMRKLFRLIVLIVLIGCIPLQGFAVTKALARKANHTAAVSGKHSNGPSVHHDVGHKGCDKCCTSAAGYFSAAIAYRFCLPIPLDAASSERIAFTSAHFYRIAPKRRERPPLDSRI
jgi:hypothetical protein